MLVLYDMSFTEVGQSKSDLPHSGQYPDAELATSPHHDCGDPPVSGKTHCIS